MKKGAIGKCCLFRRILNKHNSSLTFNNHKIENKLAADELCLLTMFPIENGEVVGQ